MKTLKLLTLGAIAGGLALSMSSCIKSSDPDFTLGLNQVFVSQRGAGATATFAPYISIFSPAYQIKSASASNNGQSYSFSRIGLYGNTMELTNSFYGGVSYSSDLPKGIFAITAIDAEAVRQATSSVTFSLEEKYIMGDLTVNEFTYTANGGITAKWDLVQNATAYGLVVTPFVEVKNENGGTDQVSLGKNLLYWGTKADDKLTSGTFNPDNYFSPGQMLRVSVAAFSSKNNLMPDIIVKESNPITIKWGTDYDAGAPESPVE